MAFRVLFVCTGNICRSPLADGMLRALVSRMKCNKTIEVDSAGTDSYHIGQPPDPRSQKAARAMGYDISSLRARALQRNDFYTFNLILAMDEGHMATLQRLKPEDSPAELRLFLHYAPEYGYNVPDPYYDGPEAFDHVARMIEDGCLALAADLSQPYRKEETGNLSPL